MAYTDRSKGISAVYEAKMVNKVASPCYKCPDRHEACHGHCDRYDKFLAEREAVKKERKRQNAVVSYRAFNYAFQKQACNSGRHKRKNVQTTLDIMANKREKEMEGMYHNG